MLIVARIRSSHCPLATALAAGLLVTWRVSAASITFNCDQTSDGTAASGAAWLQAVFSDSGPGTVQLTLAAPGSTENDSVKQLFFKLDPALDPNSLVFTQTNSSSGAIGTVQMERHAFKPDWRGNYDILISFSGPAPLTGGDSITYSVSESSSPAGSAGSGQLSAASFDFPSAAATKLAGTPGIKSRLVGTASLEFFGPKSGTRCNVSRPENLRSVRVYSTITRNDYPWVLSDGAMN